MAPFPERSAVVWRVIYSWMTQVPRCGTWQDPPPETPLPSCQITGDAVARETGLC